MQTKFLDDLAQQLAAALPPGLRDAQQDFQRQARALLQSTLTRMNLVTREQFEVQQHVLATTRAKLTELERQVAELEKVLQAKQP